MHFASADKMDAFCAAYLAAYRDQPLRILDVGSAVIGGGGSPYRTLFDRVPWQYCGMDVELGPNVEVAVREPYDWKEFPDCSFDVVVSGQAFEHIEFPWVTISEIARVLKPNGLVALIAPSRGHVHRYPLDCWRYYPDGFPALARFAGLTTLESHVQQSFAYPGVQWGDAVLIAQRPQRSPTEERHWAARNRAAKLSLPDSRADERLLAEEGEPERLVPSVIEPAVALGAIEQRERARLAEADTFPVRAAIAGTHLSQFWKVLTRRPFRRLTHY